MRTRVSVLSDFLSRVLLARFKEQQQDKELEGMILEGLALKLEKLEEAIPKKIRRMKAQFFEDEPSS